MIEDTENRRAINAHSPVDVYIPTEDSEFVGRDSGTWWPYRVQAYWDAEKRTRDRCLSYMIDVADAAYDLGPYSVKRLSKDIEPNLVHARSPCGFSYRSYDLGVIEETYGMSGFGELFPNLVIPITEPYTTQLKHLYRGQYEFLEECSHISLTHLWEAYSNHENLVELLRAVREIIGWDVHLHLSYIYPTTTLAEAIRDQPGLVDSLSVNRVAISDLSEKENRCGVIDQQTLTKTGSFALTDGVPPGVKIAVEFSYLCTPLYERSAFDKVAARTSIVDSKPEPTREMGNRIVPEYTDLEERRKNKKN